MPPRSAQYFMARLRELQKKFECIGDVRGKGLMIGMELITDRASRKPATALCQRVLTRAFHNGLLLLSCGVSTVRFIPPLMVSRAQVDEAMVLLESALAEALAESLSSPAGGRAAPAAGCARSGLLDVHGAGGRQHHRRRDLRHARGAGALRTERADGLG